jgi:hypothetical protein
MFARGNPELQSCLDASGRNIISQLLIGLNGMYVELNTSSLQYIMILIPVV